MNCVVGGDGCDRLKPAGARKATVGSRELEVGRELGRGLGRVRDPGMTFRTRHHCAGLKAGAVVQVASGLHRVAAIRHVLHSRRSKSLNELSYFARFERLLICGLMVRFHRGSFSNFARWGPFSVHRQDGHLVAEADDQVSTLTGFERAAFFLQPAFELGACHPDRMIQRVCCIIQHICYGWDSSRH